MRVLVISEKSQPTIARCFKTALLVDAFWERWLVHGLEKDDLDFVRSTLNNVDQWVDSWSALAKDKVEKAEKLLKSKKEREAELHFRKASLYYNVLQWIFPDPTDPNKQKWYDLCLHYNKVADLLSIIESRYVSVTVDGYSCFGRIRIPNHPTGVVIIINPIDSNKDEVWLYEEDFLKQGLATVSFDGPGQGETWTIHNVRANQQRQKAFIDRVIDYTRELTRLPIYVFGTSSGASWAVYSSSHPEVSKVVAVSPTPQRPDLFLPSYFNARLNFILDEYEYLPNYVEYSLKSQITVYHGAKDAMVRPTFIDELVALLPYNNKLVVFEDEGHCCNYKLSQIRQESIDWLKKENNDN